MLQWAVTGAWVLGGLLAVVVLGFAGYELRWKLRRLAADRVKLENVIAELTATAGQLHTAAERARTSRPGSEA